MPTIAQSRRERPGWKAGLAWSWAVMSGDTLINAQPAASLPRTAIEDWVRTLARTVPLRTPAQLRQLQFHCGKPPPAAAPSSLIFIAETAGEEGDATPPAHAGRRHSIWSRTMFNQR